MSVFLRSVHYLGERSFAKNSNANRNATHPCASSLLKEPLARLESGKIRSRSDGIWAKTSQDIGLFPLQSVTPQGYGKGYGKTINSNPRVSGFHGVHIPNRGLVPGSAAESLTTALSLQFGGSPRSELHHSNRAGLRWPQGEEPLSVMPALVSLPYAPVPASSTVGLHPVTPRLSL